MPERQLKIAAKHRRTSVRLRGNNAMGKLKKDQIREDRIHNEAIVDAGPDEQAISWYSYLESKISFPFQVRCVRCETCLATEER